VVDSLTYINKYFLYVPMICKTLLSSRSEAVDNCFQSVVNRSRNNFVHATEKVDGSPFANV
jgi:hypothetical protein